MNQSEYLKQSESFYNAIINDDINFITTFLNTIQTANLHSQFKYPYSVNFLPSGSQVSPIIIAIMNNKLSILKLLINKTPAIAFTRHALNHHYKEHNLPLIHYAVSTQNIDMIDYVLSLYSNNGDKCDINSITSTLGRNPLHFAAKFLTVQHVHLLIEHYYCNPLIITKDGKSILYYAAFADEDPIEMFQYLLSLPDVKKLLEHRNNGTYTILHTLGVKNKPITCKYLIETWNVNLQWKDTNGFTLAHAFAQNGNIEMIDYLYHIDSNLIRQVNNRNTSILFSAAINNQLGMVQHLIQQYDFNIYETDSDGSSLLHVVHEHESIELIDYIISLDDSFFTKVDHYNRSALFSACSYGNINNFLHLIKFNRFNIRDVDDEGCNLMHCAVLTNKKEMIQTVSMTFAEHLRGEDGFVSYATITGEWSDDIISPLHLVMEELNLSMFKELVRLKANITTTNTISKANEDFTTLLQYALYCSTDDYSILEYLLSDECLQDWNNQIEFKYINQDDETTIEIYNQKDPIQPQLEIIDPFDSLTPILSTAATCDLPAFKLLYKRGANIYQTSGTDENILHVLLDYVDLDTISPDNVLEFIYFLFSISTINQTQLLQHKTSETPKRTPLLCAAAEWSFGIVQELLPFDINIDDYDCYQRYLLHTAALNNSYSIVDDLLLYYNKELMKQLYLYDDLGKNPFHYSVLTIKSEYLEQDEDDDDDADDDDNEDDNEDDEEDDDDDEEDDDEDDEEDDDDDEEDDDDSVLSLHSHSDIYDDINFDLQNPDIKAFLEFDPALLLTLTTHGETILHLVVTAEADIPTRLAGLIERLVGQVDDLKLE